MPHGFGGDQVLLEVCRWRDSVEQFADRFIGEKGSIDRSALLDGNMLRSAFAALNGAATDIATITPNMADVLRSTPGIDPDNVLQLGDPIHIVGNSGLNMSALESINQVNSRMSSRLGEFISL